MEPLWSRYNFAPRLTHKTFDAEEAEEKFAERGKILNYWAVMVNKKLKPGKEDEDDEDLDDEGKKKKKGPKGKGDLKVSGKQVTIYADRVDRVDQLFWAVAYRAWNSSNHSCE